MNIAQKSAWHKSRHDTFIAKNVGRNEKKNVKTIIILRI